jgi:uncharacterized membrane protein (DUF485 family)
LDKFGRGYAYFLLIVCGIAALMRLVTSRRLAAINSQRLQPESKRNRQRWIGIAVVLGSFVLVPVYFFFRAQTWMLLAAGVGVLSGAEFVANAAAPRESSLVRQNQVFGGLYAVATILVYLLIFR